MTPAKHLEEPTPTWLKTVAHEMQHGIKLFE
jgi:hypothetical protein